MESVNLSGTRRSRGAQGAEICVFALVTTILLTPAIQPFRGFPSIRLEQILVVGICYLYLIALMAGGAHRPEYHYPYLWLILFSVLVMGSLVYGAVFLKQEIIGRDYYEVPKIWLAVLLFMIGFEARLGEKSLRRFLVVLGLCTVTICAYAAAQYWRLPGVDVLDNFYFLTEDNYNGMIRYGRIYATFGNANVLGQFLSCMTICYITAVLGRVGRRMWSTILTLLAMLVLTLTASRYGLISTSFGSLLVLALVGFSGRRNSARIAAFFLLCSALAGIYVTTEKGSPYIQARSEELRHPEEVRSVRDRLDNLWLDSYDDLKVSPILGYGPSKKRYGEAVTDSEDLDVLRRYGLLGFAVYFSVFLWVLIKLFRGLKAIKSLVRSQESAWSANVLMVCAGFVLTLMDIGMNIGMSTFYNFQFGSFFWLFLGLATRSAQTVTQVSAQSVPHSIRSPIFAPVLVSPHRSLTRFNPHD